VDPGLFNGPVFLQEDKVGSLANVQLATVIQSHGVSYVFRTTHHSLLHPDIGPLHQVPHTLVQANASPNQCLGSFDGHFVSDLDLVERDLSVAWVYTVWETGQLDAVSDEDTVTGSGTVGNCNHPRVKVNFVSNKREVWRFAVRD
jgi:hypothetical protein